MRRILFTLSLILTFVGQGYAQERWELTGLAGYATSSSKLPAVGGDYKLKHSVSFGGTVGFRIVPQTVLELSYHRQNTDLWFDPRIGARQTLFPITANFLQLGIVREFLSGQLRPFGLFSVGPAWYHPDRDDIDAEWRFSTIFGAGLKYMPKDSRIGLRFQARLVVPWFGTDTGIWCGLGGCSPNVSSSETIVTGDFQGGVVIRLGDDIENSGGSEW